MTTAKQVFLSSSDSVISTGTIAANIFPVENTAKRISVTREGSGLVSLGGSYTGADDAIFDIEFLSTGGDPIASAPIFNGVGNGTLTDITLAPTIDSQTFTVTLKDISALSAKAVSSLYGVDLQASYEGAWGNSVAISVDTSGLSFVPLLTLVKDLPKDTVDVVGAEYDFGAGTYELLSNGEFHSATARIRIGEISSPIFRQYKTVEADTTFSFSPKLPFEAPAGTVIYQVTGSYEVTISATASAWVATQLYTQGDAILEGGRIYWCEQDGTSGGVIPTFPTNGGSVSDGSTAWRDIGPASETHSNIITLYDLLASIRDNSRLLKIVTVFVKDSTPGGSNGRDLDLRTVSYALPSYGEGSQYATGLESVTVSSGAITELLKIECYNNTAVGGELWTVTGGVSGGLSDATTGVAYSEAGIAGFTIPSKLPETDVTLGNFTFGQPEYVDRDATEGTPNICPRDLHLGRLAENKTITWTYKEKPVFLDCNCDNTPIESTLSEECLGTEIIDSTGGTMDAVLKQMLQDAYELKEKYLDADTMLAAYTPTVAYLYSQPNDIKLVTDVVDIMSATARKIYAESSAVTKWNDLLVEIDTDLDVILGEVIGISGQASKRWEDGLALTKIYAASSVSGIVSYSNRLEVPVLRPSTLNGRAYINTLAKGRPLASGSVAITTLTSPENSWPDITDATVSYPLTSDSNIVLTYVATAKYWEASTSYAAGYELLPYNGYKYTSDGGGASGTTEPDWDLDTDTVVDGAITWTRTAFSGATLASTAATTNVPYADYLAKWQTKADLCLIEAGIDPKTEASTNTESPCWQDRESEYWWVPNDGKYLPAFTNVGYTSVTRQSNLDGTTSIVSTQEFYFVLAVKEDCIPSLKVGDNITMTISDVTSSVETYKVGDLLYLPIVNGTPLSLTSGVTGQDVLTFGVVGSRLGTLADYEVDLDLTPTAYNDSGVEFLITPGTISFQLGDSWQFSQETASFRWRKDSGAFSSYQSLSTLPVALSDGVEVSFILGIAPSFVDGDTYSFKVLQPYSYNNVKRANSKSWKIPSNSETLTVTLDAASDVEFVAVWHTCPSVATLTIEGSTDNFATTEFSKVVTIDTAYKIAGIKLDQLYAGITHIRLVTTNADESLVYWLYAGEGISLTYNAKSVQLKNTYNKTLRRHTRSATISTTDDGRLTDITTLNELMAYHLENDNEPLLLLPQDDWVESRRLVELPDEVTYIDRVNYYLTPKAYITYSLELEGVPV